VAWSSGIVSAATEEIGARVVRSNPARVLLGW
jgi:hypothetical protein